MDELESKVAGMEHANAAFTGMPVGGWDDTDDEFEGGGSVLFRPELKPTAILHKVSDENVADIRFPSSSSFGIDHHHGASQPSDVGAQDGAHRSATADERIILEHPQSTVERVVSRPPIARWADAELEEADAPWAECPWTSGDVRGSVGTTSKARQALLPIMTSSRASAASVESEMTSSEGRDIRTSSRASAASVESKMLMIRNLPPNVTKGDIAQQLSLMGLADRYDFLHVPVDFDTGIGRGHAFVNFDTPGDAKVLSEAWDDQMIFDASYRSLSVVPSSKQGMYNMKWGVSRYSRVKTDDFRPFVRGWG